MSCLMELRRCNTPPPRARRCGGLKQSNTVSSTKSIFSDLPTDLILKIIREADGGKSTHKLRLDKCLKEIKDTYWRYGDDHQEDDDHYKENAGMMAVIWGLNTAYPIGCYGFCERYGLDMYSLNIHPPNPNNGETMEDFNRAVRWADYIQGWICYDKYGCIPNYNIQDYMMS